MVTSFEGTVERITYRNEDNLFTVFRFVASGGEVHTCVGTLAQISVGEKLKISGSWVRHDRYGLQFSVKSALPITPSTLVGIEKYLGSGLIKGVGPSTAKRLVAAFGVETLDVIENQPERLTSVEGIGEKTARSITDAFLHQKDIQDVMVFLQGNGVSPTLATKIYQEYGKQSIAVVTENPYRLADEIFGVGFKTADQIALNLGLKKDDPNRLKAGIRYALLRSIDYGHTYLPKEELLANSKKLLGQEIKETLIEELVKARQLIMEDSRCYVPSLYDAENRVAENLLRFKKQINTLPFEASIDTEMVLAGEQLEAVNAALKEKVLIITGGPGTGKTTITKVILSNWEEAGLKVLLASPTGRAAKRLSETTGQNAKTIHRLLEYGFGNSGMGFQRNENNKLKADAIIIDEFSMVDIRLFDSLLKAVDEGTRLLFVGDSDQLPAVGPGNILKDLIDSGKLPVVKLTKIFRQKEQSQIVLNAHRINQGLAPNFASGGDFKFYTRKVNSDIFKFIVDWVDWKIKEAGKKGGAMAYDAIQVLSPMRKGENGVDNLNKLLQERLNPAGKKNEIVQGYRVLREHDKVMQIRNNYQKDIYNGDIGKIIRIDPESRTLDVLFNDEIGERVINYTENEIEELTLAYAISVHKSQGSEYPAVIMPVTTQHYMLLQRNLLYTGITRARNEIVLVGNKSALYMGIKNNKTAKRYSYLNERLKSGCL